MRYLPLDFGEVISAVTIVSGLILCILSMQGDAKAKASKFAGILLILGLSIFANNPITYVAAIFIIATIVTKLEFLESLVGSIAGIFRKDNCINGYNPENAGKAPDADNKNEKAVFKEKDTYSKK